MLISCPFIYPLQSWALVSLDQLQPGRWYQQPLARNNVAFINCLLVKTFSIHFSEGLNHISADMKYLTPHVPKQPRHYCIHNVNVIRNVILSLTAFVLRRFIMCQEEIKVKFNQVITLASARRQSKKYCCEMTPCVANSGQWRQFDTIYET